MTSYIINSPQLQSAYKRISGLIAWLICWLMWIYLMLPLLTLGGWLLGEKTLVDEMRWFGGYKSLLQLMQIYAFTLLAIMAIWVCWVLLHLFRSQKILAQANKCVTDQEICEFYQVDQTVLDQSRKASCVTAYFDNQGHIVKLEHDTQLSTKPIA